MTTAASASTPVGNSISDSGTLAGGFNPTGTITFNLYGPGDAVCGGLVTFTSTVPVSGNGTYGSGPFTPAVAGTYRWTAAYSGDPNNLPSSSPCNAANESSVVTPVTPSLTTNASPDVTVTNLVSDTATLAAGFNPTGTITFSLYGPNDAICSAAPFTTSVSPVSGNGVYSSAPIAPLAGTYRWIASYSGDANNNPVITACADPLEDVVVSPMTTTLLTTASAGVTVGGSVSDISTLSGGLVPSGTISFSLFGPNDATCTGAPVFTSSVPVAGNGAYPSGPFTTTAAGTYRWTADYSGDINNAPSSSACNAANESVVVAPAAPTVTTVASPTVVLGNSVSDAATLSGGVNPTGTIAFTLYGPDDATCGGASVFTAGIPVAGNGIYNSGTFTPSAAGTYRWIASYGGDSNNSAFSSACNDAGESVIVSPALTTLTTMSSAGVTVGGTVNDTATLSGGSSPTGTITFSLFGPDDATCGGTAVFTSSVAVSGNGSYPSASFTTSAAGVYRWIAVYSGDANNASSTSVCNAPNESVVVGVGSTTLTTIASPSVAVGGSISDSATLAGGVNPVGTITFNLFGPNNATCSGAPISSSSATVSGNGTYPSGSFTTTTAGTYRWAATYGGDANNAPATSPCNAANESVTVTQVVATLTTAASPSVSAGGTVSDSAAIAGGASPTGTVTFRLYGPNDAVCGTTPVFTSAIPVTGNGTYSSASFTTSAAGTYRWVASYSGDTNNAAVNGACNAPNESVVVSSNTLTITNSTPSSVALGGSVSDTAVLAGGSNPTGTLTFQLFGPGNGDCSGTPIFTSSVTVAGNGSYTSAAFTPSAPGTYRWVVIYSGDANNAAVTTLCSDPNAVFTVATVAAVPTLDSLGLILLAFGLAVIGVAAMRGVR